MPVEAGQPAPDFTLPSSAGGELTLSSFRGRNIVVLYFYPKDNTSGCTREACAFRDARDELAQLGAVVIGVSPDSLKSHDKFIRNHNLNFPLLADEEKQVCEAYGVWVQKSMYGRKYMGVERSTFIIDREGRIARAWRKVSVAGHDDEVIAAVRELTPARSRRAGPEQNRARLAQGQRRRARR